MSRESDELPETELGDVIFTCLQALEAGQPLDREQLRMHYPKFAAALDRFFANQEHLERLAAPLRQVVATDTVPDLAEFGAPSDSLPAGLRVLGDYELLAEIGRGGMGVVFKARQRSLNRLVALKMLVAGPLASSEERRRCRQEAETAAALEHPHIVPIYEVGEVADQPFFSMKLVEGGSLAQQQTRLREDPHAAARLLATLARAVQFAHERGILHRDLKPSNILLEDENRPFISDFGLAKRLPADGAATASASGHLIGSPLYMAPEQAQPARGPVTAASDVYGLGGILYTLLAGRPAFQADTFFETLQRVLGRDPQPPRQLNPRVPSDLEAICLKCLAKEPARRYASAQALADDLEAFLRGERVTARPVRAWERAWKWARRRPALALLALVSMLASAGLVVGLLVHTAQLDQARQEAEDSANEARRQQERARASYRQARDTLEQMLKQFDTYGLGQVPQLQELHSRQLEQALAFYQDALKEQDSSDPAVRGDAAFAYKRAADIQQTFGRRAPARENYGHALALLEALPPEYRNLPGNRRLRLGCFNNRGVLVNQEQRGQDAEHDHRQALALAEGLLRDDPANPWDQFALAETENFLGALYHGQRRYAEAEPHYDRASAGFAATLAAEPHSALCQFRLADTLGNLAVLYQLNLKRLPEATRKYEQAEALLQDLRTRHPAEGSYPLSLAALYGNWGFLLRAEGKQALALKRHSQAVELADAVLAQEPRHGTARRRSFTAHGSRAQFYEAQGRYAEAAADWESALAVDEQPDAWTRRLLRALDLVRSGQHARAVGEARQLQDDPVVSDEGRYNVACVWSLAAAQAGTDAKLAEQYADQALALLGALRARGYFRRAEHLRDLLTDPDLAGLRWRLDFLRLLWPQEPEKK